MAKTKTARPRAIAKKVVELVTTTAVEPAELKSYAWGDSAHPGFFFSRYWWEGLGPRAGITPWVEKKIQPGDDPVFGKAAKVEVMLPDTAPSDYANLAFLLRQVDEALPPFERHVMVQAKIVLDPDEPWHVGYERVRAFARSHFSRRGFPVVLVGHVPSIAGLNGYGSHVHCIVLARPVTINGLGGPSHPLCSDKGYREARDAWKAWLAAEGKAA